MSKTRKFKVAEVDENPDEIYVDSFSHDMSFYDEDLFWDGDVSYSVRKSEAYVTLDIDNGHYTKQTLAELINFLQTVHKILPEQPENS